MRTSTHNARALQAPALIMMSLLALGSVACATSGTPVPKPFPGAVVANAPAAPASAPDGASTSAPGGATVDKSADMPEATDLRVGRFDGRAVAEFALGFRGVPYRLGGSDPAGFDCSGLVHYVYSQYGVAMPRVVEQQFEFGEKIKPKEIKPGDLIFFDTKKLGSGASHVGIAIGRDTFVHAPNSTGVVRVESLSSSYWGARYIGARRIPDSTITN